MFPFPEAVLLVLDVLRARVRMANPPLKSGFMKDLPQEMSGRQGPAAEVIGLVFCTASFFCSSQRSQAGHWALDFRSKGAYTQSRSTIRLTSNVGLHLFCNKHSSSSAERYVFGFTYHIYPGTSRRRKKYHVSSSVVSTLHWMGLSYVVCN